MLELPPYDLLGSAAYGLRLHEVRTVEALLSGPPSRVSTPKLLGAARVTAWRYLAVHARTAARARDRQGALFERARAIEDPAARPVAEHLLELHRQLPERTVGHRAMIAQVIAGDAVRLVFTVRFGPTYWDPLVTLPALPTSEERFTCTCSPKGDVCVHRGLAIDAALSALMADENAEALRPLLAEAGKPAWQRALERFDATTPHRRRRPPAGAPRVARRRDVRRLERAAEARPLRPLRPAAEGEEGEGRRARARAGADARAGRRGRARDPARRARDPAERRVGAERRELGAVDDLSRPRRARRSPPRLPRRQDPRPDADDRHTWARRGPRDRRGRRHDAPRGPGRRAAPDAAARRRAPQRGPPADCRSSSTTASAASRSSTFQGRTGRPSRSRALQRPASRSTRGRRCFDGCRR